CHDGSAARARCPAQACSRTAACGETGELVGGRFLTLPAHLGDDIEIRTADLRELQASRKLGRDELLRRLRAFRGDCVWTSGSTATRRIHGSSGTWRLCANDPVASPALDVISPIITFRGYYHRPIASRRHLVHFHLVDPFGEGQWPSAPVR